MKKVWRSFVGMDPMNEPFKAIRWKLRLWFVAEIFFTAATFWFIKVGNINVAIVSLVGLIMAVSQYHMWSLASTRRELWFVEHRLGLPKVEDELEDVEAYEEWLKEYLERGGENGARDG